MTELDLVSRMIDFLLMVVPVLLPFGILAILIDLYIDANKKAFLASQEYTLLEVVPPQEVTKSPAAMELFLMAVYQTSGESTWYDRNVKGQSRPWFSLEITSTEGNVRFFIWTRDKFAKLIESQLYSQFPGIEVYQTEDYTLGFSYDPDRFELFGLEYALTQPDPYPIKTYVDYGLDKEQEEDYKVDPITPTIEFLGSLGPGEHGWIQILVRAHKKEDPDPNSWFGVRDNWKETAKDEIKKIRSESLIDAGGETKQVQTTKGQELRIAALERSVSKLAFDTGIRSVYITDKAAFQGANIGAMIGAFKQFGSLELNGFRPEWTTSFDYPWDDPSGRRLERLKEEIIEAYKERGYFFRSRPDFAWWRPVRRVDRNYFILNTEELATIYHFPGRVSGTPSVQRVTSKKATPPPNLPV